MADPTELKKQLEDLNDEFDKISRSITSIASTIQFSLSKSLNGAVEDAKNLASQFEKGENIAKGVETQLKKNKKAIEETFLKEIKLQSDLSKAITDRNYKDQKKIKAALTDLNIQKQILYQLDTQLRTLEKMNEEYQKQNNVFAFLNSKFKDINKAAEKLFSISSLITGAFKAIIDSGLRFNKISVDLGKNLGYGVDNANNFTKELVTAVQESDNLNFTLQNASEAINELNAATGYVAEYSKDALETQIMLTKQFGLTGDEAAGIYKLSVLTGKSAEKVNDEMVGAFVAARNQLGKAVPFKATMAEAAKVSGILASNLQNSPPAIVKAVVATKALGTSLEQTAKQGEALLNFESSIESELKAELLTGKQLNLERARAAALAGDQVTAAQELFSQVGSLAEFDRMNVLQKKAIAEAVGLTADELADQLRKQKIAQEQGKSLAQITKEEADEAQRRQSIQDKFNQAILKLQDLIGNLVAGPMGAFIESLSKGLDLIGKMFGKIGKVGEMIKSIPGMEYVGKIVGGIASMATVGALIGLVARSLLKGTYINPMITKDFSVAGGGRGGGGFFGGGGGSGKAGNAALKAAQAKGLSNKQIAAGFGGKAAKNALASGTSLAGGKGLLKGLGKFAKGNALTALAFGGIEAASNLSEGKGAGESIGRALITGLFSLGGGALGSLLGPVGTIGGGIGGGLLGGEVGDMIFGKADDMAGYGARTLVTPKGPIALNNQDTVIAGTNLFKGDDVTSFPKGALNLSGGVDLTPMITALNEVKTAITGISNRPIKLYVDGTEIITKTEKSTTRTA